MSDFTHPFLLRPWDVRVSFGEHCTSVKQCFLPLSGCVFPKGGDHLTTLNDIECGHRSTGWGQNYPPQLYIDSEWHWEWKEGYSEATRADEQLSRGWETSAISLTRT